MGLYCDVLRLPGAALADCEALRADETAMVAQMQAVAKGWLELDKSWHGLHVLLNPAYPEARWPRGFLFVGGKPLTERDWTEAYGVAAPDLRLFTPKEAAEIGAVLDGVSDREMLLAYDPDLLQRHDVYPRVWERRALLFRWAMAKYLKVSEPAHYLVGYLGQLRAFVGDAVREGDGLVIKYHQ